jgi:hypothetical protein
MSDTTDLLKQLKAATERGEEIDPKTRDMLMYTAFISLFEMAEQIKPIIPFVKIGVWFLASWGAMTIGLLFSLFTGQIELVRP